MREHANNLMHRNPGAADAGLAMTDLWAYGNSVIHMATLAHPPFRLKHILEQGAFEHLIAHERFLRGFPGLCLQELGFPGLNFVELDYAAFGAGASSMLVMCRMAHSMYFCAYESGSETPTPTSMVFFLTNAKS
jgi:hypothetical protein